ncbi:hypothetical protein MPTK1_6g10350 [Marchantia polymorpha subsp. ruderalis]|uniref:Uncharacterized protein n=1 Tax=Marchantia polymorpha subsp. ruderalis TaxID=1480154 RepID=A0AAF6BQJ7_MARPO|nr:hypothetical protein Mp_6g10350 [Marchantia polymorpha subsp. ruderalis]
MSLSRAEKVRLQGLVVQLIHPTTRQKTRGRRSRGIKRLCKSVAHRQKERKQNKVPLRHGVRAFSPILPRDHDWDLYTTDKTETRIPFSLSEFLMVRLCLSRSE